MGCDLGRAATDDGFEAPALIETKADKAAIYELRALAWTQRMPDFRVEGAWHDAFDGQALHIAIRRKRRIVAAVRVTLHRPGEAMPDGELYDGIVPVGSADRIAVLSRMFCLKEFAGRGLPERLDKAMVEAAIAADADIAIASTDKPRRKAGLAALGFTRTVGKRPYASGPLSQGAPIIPDVFYLRLTAGAAGRIQRT